MITIKKNGTDITALIEWQSAQITEVLTKEVSRLEFAVVYNAPNGEPASMPGVGDLIDVYEDGDHIFGGSVTETELTVDGGFKLRKTIHCTDWSYLLDGRLVHKNYAQMDPADIVADLVANFATGKGITTNHVQRGNFLVTSIKFNYEPFTKCLEKLAKMIGWEWYVDPDKDIHFFLIEGTAAPFAIDDDGGNLEWQTLDIGLNLQNMKNSVFVIGGNYKKNFTSATTLDVYQTDGIRSTFALAYNYDSSNLHVTLNGVAQTIGIDQQDNPSGFQVMFNDRGRFIYFNSVPASGKTVKAFGDARIPIVAHASDAAAIAEFGEYQDVIVDNKILTVPEAQARAQAEILQFGEAVHDIKFRTLRTGLRIGQTILLNSATLGFTDTPLIIKNIVGAGYSPNLFEYTVECLGSDKVTFVDLMSNLLRQEAAQNPVDDSIVNQDIIFTPDEELKISDTVTATATAALAFLWGTSANNSKWGFTTWG